MSELEQLKRYKKLLAFIEENFKENIQIQQIEDIAFYSYRNINRIFLALQRETIGKYIRRLRLEKAAEYLKYSNQEISDIALELGYSDIAAFSKAFKNKFRTSPSSFRQKHQQNPSLVLDGSPNAALPSLPLLDYEIVELPSWDILYLEYLGSYHNIAAINQTWQDLENYAAQQQLIQDDSIFFAEILDDEAITSEIHCRYRAALVLPTPLDFLPEGLFQTKVLEKQKYAKFIHQGSHESSLETYDQIYTQWLENMTYEFADKPVLEIFTDPEAPNPITEIYIPIL